MAETAQDSVRRRKQETLDAVSQAGSRGLDLLKQRDAAAREGRLDAINRTISEAGFDLDPTFAKELQTEIAGTKRATKPAFDLLLSGFEQDLERQRATAETGFGELEAAIPLLEEETARGVSQLRAEFQDRESQRKAAVEQQRLQLETTKVNLQAARERAAQTAAGLNAAGAKIPTSPGSGLPTTPDRSLLTVESASQLLGGKVSTQALNRLLSDQDTVDVMDAIRLGIIEDGESPASMINLLKEEVTNPTKQAALLALLEPVLGPDAIRRAEDLIAHQAMLRQLNQQSGGFLGNFGIGR